MLPVPAGRAVDVWWSQAREAAPGPGELAWLSARERERAGRLAFAADRERFLAAHVMLRRVLSQYTGTGPGALEFGRAPCPSCGGPSGRPVLVAGTGPAGTVTPSFSLAHSGDVAVLAVAGRAVGADVERDPAGCVCSLAGAAHRDDSAVLAGLAGPERHAAVIGWWVRAEAVLKCGGEGIAHGLAGFPVLTGDVVHGCSATGLAAPPGYRAALALAGPGGIGPVTARGPRER